MFYLGQTTQSASPEYPRNTPEIYNRNTANTILMKLESGYFSDLDTMLRNADQSLPANQRLFEYDFRMVARLLTEYQIRQSGRVYANFEAWYILLRNNMGWRIAEIPACQPGTTLDDITKQCVEYQQPVIPQEPEPGSVEASLSSGLSQYMPFIFISLSVLVVAKLLK